MSHICCWNSYNDRRELCCTNCSKTYVQYLKEESKNELPLYKETKLGDFFN